jgi:hypothetical protein
VCIPALFESVRSLQRGVENIKYELAELSNVPDATSNDWFIPIMEAFVTSADLRVQEILRKAERTERELSSLLEYFGEDPKKREAAPEEFFRVIWEFQIAINVSKPPQSSSTVY